MSSAKGHYDFTGRAIMPGDLVAHSTMICQSANLELAIVVSCPYSKQKYNGVEYPTLRVFKMVWRGENTSKKLISLQYPERCVILKDLSPEQAGAAEKLCEAFKRYTGYYLNKERDA